MKILLVIDMQKDFVTGVLGTAQAREIVSAVSERVEEGKKNKEKVIFTRDTHTEDYLHTQEGKFLPVSHCVKGSDGWEIIEELDRFAKDCEIIDKPTFGSIALSKRLQELDQEEKIEEITLVGVCTDICVISNAMIAKATLPEVPIWVEASCCAGVSPESHKRALEAMQVCQVQIRA